jgi:hypothetical protein
METEALKLVEEIMVGTRCVQRKLFWDQCKHHLSSRRLVYVVHPPLNGSRFVRLTNALATLIILGHKSGGVVFRRNRMLNEQMIEIKKVNHL